MRAFVGEGGNRVEVFPQAQRHGEAIGVVQLWITGRRNHFTPGVFPRGYVADRACLEAVARVRCCVDCGNAVDESLRAWIGGGMVKNSDRQKCELVRHPEMLSLSGS